MTARRCPNRQTLALLPGLLAGLVVLPLLAGGPARAQETSTAPAGGPLTQAERIHGLSTIWQEANYNFAFFDQVPALDWDSLYRAFLPRVQRSRSTYEYYRTLQRFVAALEDGHSNVYLPRSLRDQDVESEPWVRIRRVEDRALVTDVGATLAARIPVGSEILEVQGLPVRSYMEAEILPYVSASTDHHRLERAYRRLLRGRSDDNVRLVWATPDGRTRSGLLARDRHSREDRWSVEPIPPPSFDLDWPAADIVRVTLTSFANPEVVEQFALSLPDLRGARGLILDIRRNRGGSSRIADAVAARLIGDTVTASTWRTREHRAAFKAWGLFSDRRKKWAEMDAWYDGGIRKVAPAEGERLILPTVVLQEHATFSAAEDFLVALGGVSHVTTLGRTTAGSTGQPLFFALPGGGHGRVCAKRDTYADGRDFVGVGIPPDVAVAPSVEDVRAGRDVQLRRALELLGGRATPNQEPPDDHAARDDRPDRAIRRAR